MKKNMKTCVGFDAEQTLLRTVPEEILKAVVLVQCFSKQDCLSPGRTFSFFLKKCHHYSLFSLIRVPDIHLS